MPPVEKLYAKVLSLEAEVTDLRAQVAWFQRQMFAGSRSEKLPMESPGQTKLGLPESPEREATTQTVNCERRAPAPGKTANAGGGFCEAAGAGDRRTDPRGGAGGAGRL